MNYTRFQRFLSYFLIFSILFLQTVQVPILDVTRAEAKTSTDIVSLIVDEDIYSGSIKSKILRYAEDIQAYLPNSRTVIFPVPNSINPVDLASINEKLYYEGNGEELSHLVGTVLIGELPLPVVHRGSKAFLSIYPYVDFDNKSFVFDSTKGYYDYVNRASIDEKAEIWHSVIRPNTGTAEKNETKLAEFFDKSHDFYSKQGNFSPENTLSEPRVFYFDGVHDERVSGFMNWKLYDLYLKNIEDLSYNRFNKYLAKKLYDTSERLFNINDGSIKNPEINKILEENSGTTMDFANSPDITTKQIIEKATKQFFEIFNPTYMGDILRFVHNAGRYGNDTNVRVDSVPVMIAKKDIFMKQVLKDTNTVVENKIDAVVKNGLSRYLPVFTSYAVNTTSYTVSAPTENSPESTSSSSNTQIFKNYFFGRRADTIAKANQCTIVRGSSLKAEANHGFDIQAIEDDTTLLTADLPGGRCFPGGTSAITSYWGRNSPLNLDIAKAKNGSISLKDHVYKGFSKSIFDIAGSKELDSNSPLHIAMPEDCLAKDFLLQPYSYVSDSEHVTTGYWPSEKWSALQFSCITGHQRPSPDEIKDFESYYAWFSSESCTDKILTLNDATIKTSNFFCSIADGVTNIEKTYNFKKIPSDIEHKSPTDEEYGIESKSMATPSLPSDRDRYIDFIGAKGEYVKLLYPNLFRIVLDKANLNYEGTKKKIKELLDTTSTEINTVIVAQNPKNISGKAREIADLLSTGAYPTAQVDLYAMLAANPKALEAAIQGVLWKNLDNVTLKYSFVLEHSLDIDGQKNISADDRKNDYEIATLGSPGDAKNMYVKIDPEAKWPLNADISRIMDSVNEYHGLISGTNVASIDEKAEFKCGPPEGVPIWEWLPAIFCWLGTILPPTISAGSCTATPLGSPSGMGSNPDAFADQKYRNDANKNGIMDGNEIIKDGELRLSSPKDLYSYNANVPLEADLLKDGRIISIDSFSEVKFELKKLTAYSGGLNEKGKRVIYDRDGKDELITNPDNIRSYLSFAPMMVRAQSGISKYSFTAKDSDIDAVFEAHIRTKDKDGNIFIDKTSAPITISIRWERISVRSKVKADKTLEDSSVIQAGNGNGVLFALSKVNKNEWAIDQNFPYTLQVFDDITRMPVSEPISIQTKDYLFRNGAVLDKAWVYRFEFSDKRGVSGYSTITVLPAPPVQIEAVAASNTFMKGEKTTILVRLYDAFGNYAKGSVYKLAGSISGGGLFVSADKEGVTSISRNIVEGYTSFEVTSVGSNDNIRVQFHLDRPNLDAPTVSLRSVDFAKIGLEIEGKNAIVVGKEKHRIKVRVLSRDGQKLSRFNGIASLDFPKLSGTIEPWFVKIVDGESIDDIFLTPRFVAWKDLNISIQIPGIKTAEGNAVTILPDVPMNFEFSNPNPRLEAKEGNVTPVRATIFDRYGNIAYNSTGFSLSLNIPEEYHKYAVFPGGEFEKTISFSEGTLEFNASSTFIPGKGYIIGRVQSSLADNSFTVSDKSGKSITVHGVSENILPIDTYYLFNEEKVDKIRYDALYTTLLGGNYGDVTQTGYLGGSILFNPNSKSLAVTSLVNNPWRGNELFGFTPAGKYTASKNQDESAGFQAELSGNNDQSFISLYDSFSKEYIARAWLNFDPGATELVACSGKEQNHDIADCRMASKTSIVMKWFDDARVSLVDDGLVLKTINNTTLVRIDRKGKIEKYPGVELSLDTEVAGNMLGIKITSNRTQVGYIAIKFASDAINAYATSVFPSILSVHKDALLLEVLSNRYSYEKTYLGNSSRGAQGIVFLQKDPSNELASADRVYSGRPEIAGLEEYPKKTGIGWEDTNRMFLELAGGGTVWESTKFYQTFSTITLGDAVAHLPKAATTSNFDHTIGKQISSGAGEQIESYKRIDFNGDGVPDIVVFYESGKIQLLANYSGTFKDMGFLAYVADAWKERKGVGDFFHDGFQDIILTDRSGKLVLLDNEKGKFVRKDVSIFDEVGKKAELRGKIQQLEIFDMDHDGYDDIVSVDDSGELNILYGSTKRVNESREDHIFTKKLVDRSLGIELSPNVKNDGGAFYFDGLPQLPPYGSASNHTSSDSAGVNQALIDNTIYDRFNYAGETVTREKSLLAGVGSRMKRNADGSYSKDAQGNYIDDSIPNKTSANTALGGEIGDSFDQISRLAGSGRTDFSALDTSNRENTKTFIRSPFAEWKGLKVEKRYADINGGIFQGDDRVEVELILSNITTLPLRESVYLDSNDIKLFQPIDDATYTYARSGTGGTLPMEYLEEWSYDYAFNLRTISPGETVKIRYQIAAKSISFGRITVGLLEKWEAWDDVYGDIAMNSNNMCGGSVAIWRSVDPAPRSYEKGTKNFQDASSLPEELQKNTIDKDGNRTPDYIDDLIKAWKNGDAAVLKKYSTDALSDYNKDTNSNNIPDRVDQKGNPLFVYNQNSGKIEIGGLGSSNVDAINSNIDEVVKGLGCGFGGGACINSPLNWAPLAPGSSPTALGFPLNPAMMTPWSGLPVFAAPSVCPGPPYIGVWPPCPIGAGGWLMPAGISQFRLFITPTITGAIGVAACFWPNTLGMLPAPGVSPLVPGWNCVVAAKPLLGCKDDGSDGDAGSIWLGFWSDYFNANSCRSQASSTPLSATDRDNTLRYLRGDNSVLPEINASISKGTLSELSAGPMVGIGLGTWEQPNFEVSLDSEALKNFDFGSIVKIKNTRVSSFPDFIMDWATRQLEEVVNKLTSLPTLYIVLPDFSGFDIGGFTNFPEKFEAALKGWKKNDTTDYANVAMSQNSGNSSTLGGVKNSYNTTVSENADTINSFGKNISGIKAAYEFMSHLPLIQFQNQMVDISIPWASLEDMDKWYANAQLTAKQWKNEISSKQEEWAKLGSKDWVNEKVIIQAEGTLGSLQENIQIIDEYRKFPEKLQKYLTWKERYASQILCNVEAIESMMGGWLSDNGKRFRTWVELYILVKAILKSWQLVIDLFNNYNETCAPCRNERWDLKHFIFKLISAVIPKIPIIQFPKWPDIWLDLHNIRAGLRILMPEFHFIFVPIVFPQLPNLYLPSVPSLGIALPSLPLLPRLPELPDLPDLPSLPLIKLPDLPPPPTIPKLFGGIAAVLDILKIVSKILCILQINPFVPEWRAWDQIAQLTERTGKLPIDFLNIDLPNFSMSFVDGIKVTTYVNLEFEVDFILEMAKSTLDPLNRFTNNLSNIGTVIIPDVNLRDAVPGNVEIKVGPQWYKHLSPENKQQVLNTLLHKFTFDILDNFVALNQYIAQHSQEEVGVNALKDLLRDNIAILRKSRESKVGKIADTLAKAVEYKGENEQSFIADLKQQNKEKFSLIKEYIQSEKNETVRLKTEVDALMRRKTVVGESSLFSGVRSGNIQIAALSAGSPEQDVISKRIRSFNDRIIPSLTSITSGEADPEKKEIHTLGDSLISNVRDGLQTYTKTFKRNEAIYPKQYAESTSKMLALDTSTSAASIDASPVVSASSSSTTTSPMYSYQYNGIYIRDNAGKQTRLFDYIDGVDGTEDVIQLDVDKDGDDDIVYRMNNSLYIKENHTNEPTPQSSTESPKKMNWQDFLNIKNETSVVHPAPNFFEESFTASNEINFWFAPVNHLKDSLFRLEYYDYIDRFDRLASGETHKSATPSAVIHKIDLIPDLVNETVVDTSVTGFVGRKNIASFASGNGEWEITMRKYSVMSPDNDTHKIIGAARTVYTDAGGATIEYQKEGSSERKRLEFGKNTNFEFLVNTEIWVTRGNLYTFSESSEEKLVDMEAIRGLPILPGTKLLLSNKNAFTSIRYYDDSTVRLDGPVMYEYYPLGKKAKNYHVTLVSTNGWYYARMYSFAQDISSTVASLTLLSPQKEADKEGPLITFGTNIKIPVYQSQKLNLEKYINDISGITKVYIDSDITKDSNGNGNPSDDGDSLNANTTLGIKKGNTIFDLDIGPFDSLFTRKMRLYAKDANGNLSSQEISLIVYAPIPEIRSVSGSIVSGGLNEKLIGEPIDLFRFRNGSLTRIEMDHTSEMSSKTGLGGKFDISTKSGSGLVLKLAPSELLTTGKELAYVNEKTGKIEIGDSAEYNVTVTPAVKDSPMKMHIENKMHRSVFEQSFVLGSNLAIESVTSFDSVVKNGIYILSASPHSFIKNNTNTPSLAGGGYIVSPAKKAIAWVSKTGDIYLLDSRYHLTYATSGEYIVVRISDSADTIVANVLYRVKTEYIVK